MKPGTPALHSIGLLDQLRERIRCRHWHRMQLLRHENAGHPVRYIFNS